MELNDNIRNNIQRLRKERNVTQDILAAALDISVQAISKWETGTSLPDIMQLPRIARFFGVTIDYLFYSQGEEQATINNELPDDDILRIIQFRGNRMLGKDLWEKDKCINLQIPKEIDRGSSNITLNVEVWGGASIKGNIGGDLTCGGGVNCGHIEGDVNCGGGINCGDIGGDVKSGGGMNCGDIEGDAKCGGGMNCGDIEGDANCGGGINCGDVEGDVSCGGDMKSGDIGGDVECKKELTCNTISGDVRCEANIHCKVIEGDVECRGDIIYEET